MDDDIGVLLREAARRLPPAPSPQLGPLLSAGRRRRRRRLGAAVAGPTLAAGLAVLAVALARPGQRTTSITPVAPPPTATAASAPSGFGLPAPDANTLVYLGNTEWLERPPSDAQATVSRAQAIATFEHDRNGVFGPNAAPITAIFGEFHHGLPGPPQAGSSGGPVFRADPSVLAWVVVQGNATVASTQNTTIYHGCFVVEVIQATTRESLAGIEGTCPRNSPIVRLR